MKLGVALYGGGINGAASAGVLFALAEMGVRVDMICASGACAPAAACFAAGLGRKETMLVLGRFFTAYTVRRRTLPLTGGVKMKTAFWGYWAECHLETFLRQAHIRTIRDFPIPLVLPAADLASGRLVLAAPGGDIAGSEELSMLHEIPAATAVRAAAALPGLMPPRRYGRMLLCDAGVRTGATVWPLRCMGADRVLTAVSQGNVKDEARLYGEDYGALAARLAGNVIFRTRRAKANYALHLPDMTPLRDLDEGIRICTEEVHRRTFEIMDALYFKK